MCPDGATVLSALITDNPTHRLLVKAMDILIRLGAHITARDCFGRRPISIVLDKCFDLGAIRLLIQYNHSLKPTEAQTKYGKPLVSHCISRRLYALLRVILLCGADKTASLNSGCVLLAPHWDGLYEEERCWLETWIDRPHALSFHCRKTIREYYGYKLTAVLDTLNYPTILKDYLVTKHLEL